MVAKERTEVSWLRGVESVMSQCGSVYNCVSLKLNDDDDDDDDDDVHCSEVC